MSKVTYLSFTPEKGESLFSLEFRCQRWALLKQRGRDAGMSECYIEELETICGQNEQAMLAAINGINLMRARFEGILRAFRMVDNG